MSISYPPYHFFGARGVEIEAPGRYFDILHKTATSSPTPMVFAAMLIGMFLLARARFGWVLFYYLTLETLAAEVKAVPLLVQFRSEITCEAPEVLNRFQQFEAEVIQTVRVRFRVLAQSLFPEQANADADAFRCVAEVRNDLIHGRLTDIPLDDEPNVNSLVQELAERYLHAVLKKLDLSGHTLRAIGPESHEEQSSGPHCRTM